MKIVLVHAHNSANTMAEESHKGEKNFEIKDCERIQKNMSNGRVIASPHFPVAEVS